MDERLLVVRMRRKESPDGEIDPLASSRGNLPSRRLHGCGGTLTMRSSNLEFHCVPMMKLVFPSVKDVVTHCGIRSKAPSACTRSLPPHHRDLTGLEQYFQTENMI